MDNNIKLNFLKRVLTDSIDDSSIKYNFFQTKKYPDVEIINNVLKTYVNVNRLTGADWPENGHTMIGIKRLDNLHNCLDYIRLNNVEGDMIETGVWRGGACIFIKSYLKMYNMNNKLFVADSFEGLPKPDVEKYPVDEGDQHHTIDFLKVSLDEVRNNFILYDVLDDNVIFLKGWFSDTLKDNSEIKKLSILRFDGDMYGSTIDVLENLYVKLEKDGVIIIDDYCLPNCVKAVSDFRNKYNINDEITRVDNCGVFWYKK